MRSARSIYGAMCFCVGVYAARNLNVSADSLFLWGAPAVAAVLVVVELVIAHAGSGNELDARPGAERAR